MHPPLTAQGLILGPEGLKVLPKLSHTHSRIQEVPGPIMAAPQSAQGRNPTGKPLPSLLLIPSTTM